VDLAICTLAAAFCRSSTCPQKQERFNRLASEICDLIDINAISDEAPAPKETAALYEPDREPQTPEEYREKCVSLTIETVPLISHLASGRTGRKLGYPFRYSNETIDQLIELLREVVEVLREGEIVKRRDPINPERMDAVSTAERDALFQRFLGGLSLGQGLATTES
jgi:hypothetical protein